MSTGVFSLPPEGCHLHDPGCGAAGVRRGPLVRRALVQEARAALPVAPVSVAVRLYWQQSLKKQRLKKQRHLVCRPERGSEGLRSRGTWFDVRGGGGRPLVRCIYCNILWESYVKQAVGRP